MNDMIDIKVMTNKIRSFQNRSYLASNSKAMLNMLDSIKPPEDISTQDFAVKYRIIKGIGGVKVNYDPELTPYCTEIHDACDDPTKRFVIVKGPARSGKTLSFENYALKIGQFGPSRMMLWYMHSEPDVKRYCEERVEFMLENHQAIAEKWNRSPGKNKWNRKTIDGALWEWLSANKSTTRSRSAPLVVGDETDAMRPSVRDALITLIENRQREYGTLAKGLLASHPDAGPEFGIDSYLRKSDRRLRVWDCPACAHKMSPCVEIGRARLATWNIMQLINSQKDMPIDELYDYVGENISIICPNAECGLHIDDKLRLEIDRAAVWMPRGQSISSYENIVGEPEHHDRAGFVIHAFMAPFVNLRGLSQEFLEAFDEQRRTGSDNKMREVQVKSLGETFTGNDLAAIPKEWEDIKNRLTNQEYKLGLVPNWVRFLTAFVDVQGSGFETTVIGWDENKQSVLVDRYSIKQKEGLKNIDPGENLNDWDVIEPAVMNQKYPVEGSDGEYMGIAKTAVDSGGQPGVARNARFWFSQLVNRKVNPIPQWRVFLSKGDAYTKGEIYGTPRPVDKDPAGRVLKIPISERTVNVHAVKNLISNRMSVEHPGPLFMSIPSDLPEKYGKELVAETRVAGKWIKTGGERNETWDGWVMCEVCRALLAPESNEINWDNPPFWAKPFKLSPKTKNIDKTSKIDQYYNRLSNINKD